MTRRMSYWIIMVAIIAIGSLGGRALYRRLSSPPLANEPKVELRVGSAAVPVTPFAPHPDWADLGGTITTSGVWGEKFEDRNANGVWDDGEPFEDDPKNTEIDPSSKNKYDGIYLAGFDDKRLATGKHDDLWARSIVLEEGSTRLAIVSVDFIGYYSGATYYGIDQIRKLVDPKLGINEILVASTHNHEGPDTIGAWGDGALKDGKYPQYLRFVDRQIAKSISLAANGLRPARLKLGVTDPSKSPSLAGMQTRTHGRPPRFFDEELRIMQFVGRDDRTIATIINWGTHPESMEDKNTLLTSDFPHTVRETIEKRYGGTALYLSGALGAVEIIGDSNNHINDRRSFDGKDFPLNIHNHRPAYTFERTTAIGHDVAQAAIDAVERGEWSAHFSLTLKKADLKGPMDNDGYLVLAKLGVFDTIQVPVDGSMPAFKTTIYAITVGDAQIVTVPGELFPELFYGVAENKRTDCPQADTGAPSEPSIRKAMKSKYRFIFGLCPDEFGYIVPSYDWRREPVDLKKMQMRQSVDPCKKNGVPNHYHETNATSSRFAPATACVTVALLTGKIPLDAACKDLTQYSDFGLSLSRN